MERLIQFDFERATCPSCGGKKSRRRYSGRGEGKTFHSQSFSARKTPEGIYPPYRECRSCSLLYASPALSPEHLGYQTCDTVDWEEAAWAAEAYHEWLIPRLTGLPSGKALDIGCGEARFLLQLDPLQFSERVGYEPSSTHTLAGLRIEKKFFEGEEAPESFSLVTAFQVLEHLIEPAKSLRQIYSCLKPGGLLCVVSHNSRAWTHRLLSTKSPVLDLQHYQVFSPPSLSKLLTEIGFKDTQCFSFPNTYPLHYWTKLAPLPSAVKTWVKERPWGRLPLRLSLGNFATLARR